MTEHRENHSWGKEIPERILVHPSYEDIFIQELDRFVGRPRSWEGIVDFYTQHLFRAATRNTKLDEEKRDNRINKINTLQRSFLFHTFPQWKDVIDAMDETKRTLVLYDRGKEQGMCPFSIVLITKILEEYIQKYSSVFNKLAIVPRYAHYAPEYLQSPLTKVHNYVFDEEFRQVSNIYSDVVHFTDGNPGFGFGNIPILGLATREHPKRIKTIEKHEHEGMHLLFARERDMKHYRENQDLWEKNQVQYGIGYMLAEVLRAVHACEIRHIEHVGQFPMDITQGRYSTILNKKTPE